MSNQQRIKTIILSKNIIYLKTKQEEKKKSSSCWSQDKRLIFFFLYINCKNIFLKSQHMSIFRSSYFYTYSLISPHHLKGPKQSYKYSSFKIPIKKTKSLTKELFFFLYKIKIGIRRKVIWEEITLMDFL